VASKFDGLLAEIKTLHDKKNHDYTAGGSPTGNFDRVAAILAPYGLSMDDPCCVALVYLLKQLDAALMLLGRGHTSVTGEGVRERLRDVAVYALKVVEMEDEISAWGPIFEEEPYGPTV